MTKNKTSTAIALFLMFAMAFSLVALPTANAQATRETYALIGAMPNPVGVGQEVLIWFGITQFTTRPQMGWEGLSITITKPDGTTETIKDLKTDTTGSSGTVYVPTMVGNYTLQTNFPEQKVTAEAAGRTWPVGTVLKASSSEKLKLVVQADPVLGYPGVPLPTEYWTRPIDAQFYGWASISGNWLAIPPNRFAPYNEGPGTAHVLWSKPLAIGGLVGGEFGSYSYEHGDAYQGKWANPVIINGILFYNRFQLGFQGGPEQQGVIAVDLKSGEELWFRNNTRLSHGQIIYWDSFNLHGAYAYLWEVYGTTWRAFDAFTGEYVYTMVNVPAGTNVYGPKGEILRYVINSAAGWMALWNSTRAVDLTDWNVSDVMTETGIIPFLTAEFAYGSWIPFRRDALNRALSGRTIDASKYGWTWNVTIPKGLPGTAKVFMEDRIIGGNTVGAVGFPELNPVFWGISTASRDRGRLLFNKTWSLPSPNVHVDIPAGTTPSAEDGVFIVGAKDTRQYYGLSIDTGQQVWGPTMQEPALNVFSILYGGAWGASAIAYGKFFTAGMAGVVNAYDVKTGAHLWTYEATDPYNEILWGTYWPLPITIISDGKIYLFHQEHSAVDPRPRGAPSICLNATTGEEIWRIDGAFRTTRWGGQPIIGDSTIALFDTYDNRLYAVGKGPSAITVAASPKISVHGSNVLVEGMVTDVSSGTKDSALTARFPNGVPAVADECMSEWMLYVYKQFPRPADATGVEVVISVLDPNNNSYEVGRTTSDANGMFRMMFEPQVPGEYTVIATFAGSEGYWLSQAETAIGVEEAPAATPAPTPTPASVADMYFLPVSISMIIAIIAVGAVIVLMLRKR